MWPFVNQGCLKDYLIRDRLADVLALIQILAFDDAKHKEEGTIYDVCKEPRSARTWIKVAERHPEFFRVHRGQGQPRICLIARHLLSADREGRTFTPELASELISAAIRLHVLGIAGASVSAWLLTNWEQIASLARQLWASVR